MLPVTVWRYCMWLYKYTYSE